MLKASDVKGLIPNNKPEPTYFPAVEGFNQCIKEVSSKEFYLERDSLNKVIST